MARLDLKFLPNNRKREMKKITRILEDYGDEIARYAKGYLHYLVSSQFYDHDFENVKEASLYLIFTDIGYDYKIISLEYENVTAIKSTYYTFDLGKTKTKIFRVSNDWNAVDDWIKKILESNQVYKDMRFLINKIHDEREKQ